MKKTNSILAITALAIVATVVAFVSCKKETPNTLMNNRIESVCSFDPLQIEDMNAYLKDFKQKMQSSTKSDGEALSLEDAAWHLSSLANYDFGNANVECDGVRFDTLDAYVNITDGAVLLSDLAEAYQRVSSSIDKFYNSLSLDNKHFRFINAFVSDNGEVTIPIITTFSYGSKDLPNHLWYFDDVFALYELCAVLFPDTIVYDPGTTGKDSLQSKLNLVVSHTYYEGFQIPHPSYGIYYTKASEKNFDHDHYLDPYTSPFIDSRLFFNVGTWEYDLGENMCYLYDSYLGLGFDNCPADQEIVSWTVNYYRETGYINKEYHILNVVYGTPHGSPEPGHHENE